MEIHKWQPLLFSCYFLLLTVVTFAHFSTKVHDSPFMQKFLGSKRGDNVTGLEQIKRYLVRYGYMSSSHVGLHESSNKFDHALEAAVKKYQVFFGLNISGELDSSTLSTMAAPRCGVPDHFDNEIPNNLTGSFYKLGPSKWSHTNLTWTLNYGTRSDALTPIDIALTSWEVETAFFTFIDNNKNEEDYPQSDLNFGFYRGDHGDEDIFDGEGDTVAHASYPTGGQIHFNADQKWSNEKDENAYHIATVAMHEIGHALGLNHSRDQLAIMWPLINPGEIKEISDDDTSGLIALYT